MFGGVGHQHAGSLSTESLREAALFRPTSAAETSA
jgi:hypothetical protein